MDFERCGDDLASAARAGASTMRRRALLIGAVAWAMAAPASEILGAAFTDQFNSEWYTVVNAAQANKASDVRTFIARHVNLNTTDPQGRTAMSYAAQQGNLEIATMLVDAGASVELADKLGNTPLHWAAEDGKTDAARLLIRAHAPVDAQNRQGITPLMLAIGHNQLAVVKALLAGGAKPSKTDFTGRDAFGWAQGQPAIVRALQDNAKP